MVDEVYQSILADEDTASDPHDARQLRPLNLRVDGLAARAEQFSHFGRRQQNWQVRHVAYRLADFTAGPSLAMRSFALLNFSASALSMSECIASVVGGPLVASAKFRFSTIVLRARSSANSRKCRGSGCAVWMFPTARDGPMRRRASTPAPDFETPAPPGRLSTRQRARGVPCDRG